MSPLRRMFSFELACSSWWTASNQQIAWWTLISMVHCVPGTLTVNVSVLLLSLASPDESSLVIEHFLCSKRSTHFYIVRTHERCTETCVETCYKRIYKRFIPSLLFLYRQKYEVEFLLQQQWYDPRLRYSNRSQYEFLNAIHHYDDIWLPDTYFIMHGDFKDPLIPVHFALRIYRNGTVNYLMRYRFTRFFFFFWTRSVIRGDDLFSFGIIYLFLRWTMCR